jgi:hypothetical protein
MAIDIPEETRAASTPVVKRQKIGEKFVGAIVRFEQRDKTKTDTDGTRRPLLKTNGKPRQELVVHCIAMPNTTAKAGIGDDVYVPEPGNAVRLILGGKAFGDWIENRKTHRNGKICVGDVVVQQTTRAQAYDANGAPKGPELTEQAQIDSIRDKAPSTAIGVYGPITLHEPKDRQWVEAAEKAYKAATEVVLDAGSGATADDYDEPF